MSYSYVKTVFPNFKYSNVYDTKLYDAKSDTKTNNMYEPIEENVNHYSIVNEKVNENVGKKEHFGQIEQFNDNQKFYNTPIPVLPANDNNKINIDKFENEGSGKTTSDHDQYIKHVLECPSCKELLMKQFNIETDRIRNEELMELISFIIFGLFILLVIDAYLKK